MENIFGKVESGKENNIELHRIGDSYKVTVDGKTAFRANKRIDGLYDMMTTPGVWTTATEQIAKDTIINVTKALAISALLA